MKVIFVTHCFDPAKDGASVLFSQLAYGLAKKSVQVEVLTSNRFLIDDFINPRARKIFPVQEEKNGILIKRINVFSRGRKIFKFLRLLTGLEIFEILAIGPVFKDFLTIFKTKKTDWVIGGPFPTTAIFYSWLIAKKSKTKLAIIPCYHQEEKSHRNRFLSQILQKADLIFALTQNEAQFYQDNGLKKEKIKIISGIVNNFLFSHKPKNAGKFPKTPIILFLGVQVAHKRIEFLIKAMELLWKEGKKIKLVIAGLKTLYAPNIEKKIRSLSQKYKKNITYLNQVSEKKKVQLIDQATALVNPSNQESFGIVFAESWARKKPVISANIPVLREIIKDGKDGFLFEKNSVKDLAKTIHFLVTHQNMAKKMGERGYDKTIKNYRQNIVVNKFLKALTR